MQPAIPATLDHLTAPWLTDALRNAGALGHGRVTKLAVEPMPHVRGTNGVLARLRVEYTASDIALPSTMIAKLPNAEVQRKKEALGTRPGRAVMEARFYRELGHVCGFRTPACYGAFYDDTSGDHVLLLEDLSALRQPSEAELTAADLDAVVEALAASHARWWEHKGLDTMTWIPAIGAAGRHTLASFRSAWPSVAERLDGTGSVRPLGESIADRYLDDLTALGQPPRTLINTDVRADNLFFAGPAAEPVPIFIDLQSIWKGRGTIGLAAFLAFNPRRPEIEEDLLSRYHAALVHHGVQGYAFDDCRSDYVRALFRRFVGPVAAAAAVGLDNAQGTTLLDLIARFDFASVAAYLRP